MEGINIKPRVVDFFAAVLVFIVAAFTINGVNIYIDENTIYITKDLDEYEKNIKNMEDIINALKVEVDNEKKHIASYENDNYLDNVININSQIEELKFFNGFSDVRGPGIWLTVSDSVSEDENLDIMEKIVHDVDITVLLNDLKGAGAEAIAVNNKRIINISEVVCAGPLIRINGERVSAPFFISAIGDIEELYRAITEEGTYAYNLKNNYGMEVETKKVYNMSIPRYKHHGNDSGVDHKVKYAEIAER
jgi:uncharacterized protein YlxW (UPF0749 family)